MAFYIVGSWLEALDPSEESCPVTDIATNTIVSPGKVNCTTQNPVLTVTPGPTYTFAPTPSGGSSTTPVVSGSSTGVTQTPTGSNIFPVSNAGEAASSDSSLIIVIIVAVIVICLLGAFIVWRLRGRKQDDSSFHMMGNHSKNTKSSAKTGTTESEAIFSDGDANELELLSMWNIPPHEIKMDRRLAEGAFGEVWEATYMEEVVAVKSLHKYKSSTTDIKLFIEEIKLIARLDCPTIVQFIGVTYVRLVDIKMVTEFMAGGDLRNALVAKNQNTFQLPEKLEIAIQIAEALVYLQVLEPKVIHRDLKSRNVLLDPVKGAKVTDFGVSREVYDEETLTQGVGTYRWMAPEVLSDGHYSTSADIYSFGIILSELDTHQIPYIDMKNANGNTISDTAIMAQVMKGELQPSFSPHAEPWLVEFARKCFHFNPTYRPTAMEAAYFLRTKLRNLRK